MALASSHEHWNAIVRTLLPKCKELTSNNESKSLYHFMFLESNKLYVFVVSFGLCFFNLEEKHREHFNILEVYVFVKPDELQVI